MNSTSFHQTFISMLGNACDRQNGSSNRWRSNLLRTAFIALVLWPLLNLSIPPVEAAARKGFERTLLFGRNYVEATEWAKANAATCHWVRPREELSIKNGKFKLLLNVDSQKAYLNGVQAWLSAPVALRQSEAYLSESDLQTLIHPVLYPPRRDGRAKTIVLDPGHGGKDRGKPAGNHEEKRHTLALAKTLKPLLEARGYSVAMTRNEDVTLVLEDRAEIGHQKGGDLFVSLHYNSAGEGGPGVRGTEVYCMTPAGESSTNGTNDPTERSFAPGNRFDAQNAVLGYHVQRALTNKLGTEDRGVRRARFAVLRMAHMPSILVEGGFLSNPREAKLIANPSHTRKLAEAIAIGIDNYVRQTDPAARRTSEPGAGKPSPKSGRKGSTPKR